MNLGEILLGAMLPVVQSVGTAQMVELLQKAHDQNEQGYKAMVQGVYPPLKRLLVPLVGSTKTRIDDTLVAVLVDSIEQSAEANGVTLPDVTE